MSYFNRGRNVPLHTMDCPWLDLLSQWNIYLMLVHTVGYLFLEFNTPEDVVDPPGLGQHGAKKQGESNGGDPDTGLCVCVCDKV